MKRKGMPIRCFPALSGLAALAAIFLSTTVFAFWVDVTNDLTGSDVPSLQVTINHALSTEWHEANSGKPIEPGQTVRFTAGGLEIGHCWGDIGIKTSKELKGCEAGILSKGYTYRRIDMCGNVKIRINRGGCGLTVKIE